MNLGSILAVLGNAWGILKNILSMFDLFGIFSKAFHLIIDTFKGIYNVLFKLIESLLNLLNILIEFLKKELELLYEILKERVRRWKEKDDSK